MNFNKLIEIVGDEPVFETGLLGAGESGMTDLRRQLSRWTKTGKLYQLQSVWVWGRPTHLQFSKFVTDARLMLWHGNPE